MISDQQATYFSNSIFDGKLVWSELMCSFQKEVLLILHTYSMMCSNRLRTEQRNILHPSFSSCPLVASLLPLDRRPIYRGRQHVSFSFACVVPIHRLPNTKMRSLKDNHHDLFALENFTNDLCSLLVCTEHLLTLLSFFLDPVILV